MSKYHETTGTVEQRVSWILTNYFCGLCVHDITPDAHLVTDLGADDLDRVELFLLIEGEFGLPEISLDQQETLTRVGDIVAYVEQRLEPTSR